MHTSILDDVEIVPRYTTTSSSLPGAGQPAGNRVHTSVEVSVNLFKEGGDGEVARGFGKVCYQSWTKSQNVGRVAVAGRTCTCANALASSPSPALPLSPLSFS